MDVRTLLVALTCSLLAAAPRPASEREDGAALAAESERLLEAGELEQALAKVEEALEFAPDDPAFLTLAARIGAELEEGDLAWWYVILAREAMRAGNAADKPTARALEAVVERVGAPENAGEEALEAYAQSLFKLSKTCQSRKLYANAVDLLSSCQGTRFEQRGNERLERLYASDKAVAAIVDSGLDVPARPATKRRPEWIAKEDAKHRDWQDAYEIKTDAYTVITNTGYEMAQSISNAMQQMNRFYREVFQYKQRGGSMRRCVIRVYATRGEFDRHEGMAGSPTVGGFFVPLENRVATYDHRSTGKPITELWTTLFHESSHQFTRAILKNRLPAWLNEGTASYFEGAEILPGGTIATNLIPDGRLGNLLAVLKRGDPSLKQVVSYFEDGSYPGAYYPFGWGLVYFIQNFEDDRSERIYVPIYRAYMKSYKGGGKHDPFERFAEYFVKRADVEGIESFDDFAARWRTWIEELGAIHFGAEDQADVLIERARRQVAAGEPGHAAESYRWALRKRPGDARTLLELAEVLGELDQEDATLFHLRRVVQLARSQGDPGAPMPGFGPTSAGEVRDQALERMARIDRGLAEAMAVADASFVAAQSEAARQVAEAGFPRGAVYLLETSLAVLGGDATLARLEREILETSEVDLRRWRRLGITPGLELWELRGPWRAERVGVTVDAQGLVQAVHRSDLPESFRYEVTVGLASLGEAPVCGLVFGVDLRSAGEVYVVQPKNGFVGLFGTRSDGSNEVLATFPAPLKRGAKEFRLAIEVDPRQMSFFFDGKRVGRRETPPSVRRGRVGLVAQDVHASFSRIRVRY